nr:MAG TPA: hypothetical protein [Caudoviricetes sp.]
MKNRVLNQIGCLIAMFLFATFFFVALMAMCLLVHLFC